MLSSALVHPSEEGNEVSEAGALAATFPACEPIAAPAARRLEFIDAFRGFACLWVILCHVHGYWLDDIRPHGWNLTTFVTRLAGYGGKGVDLFIVLSGFCLYWPLVSKGKETSPFGKRRFFTRRARRILPAYYLALAVCMVLVLVPAIRPLLVGRPINLTDALTHAFLVQTFSPSTTAAINGSFWSLALEIQLYMAFPLLLAIGRRKGLLGIVLTGFAAAAAYQCATWYFSNQPETASWASVMPMHLPARWLEFIAGMSAATWVARPAPHHSQRAWLALGVLLPIGIIDQPLGMPGGAFSHALWGAIFAALVVVASKWPVSMFISYRRMGMLTGVGVVSYSLYLVQQPFLLLTAPAIRSLHWSPLLVYALSFAIAAPIMCGLAWLMYRAVERPFLQPSTKLS